jgi:hypothetical protein
VGGWRTWKGKTKFLDNETKKREKNKTEKKIRKN